MAFKKEKSLDAMCTIEIQQQGQGLSLGLE
jgi:hypothetical protein